MAIARFPASSSTALTRAPSPTSTARCSTGRSSSNDDDWADVRADYGDCHRVPEGRGLHATEWPGQEVPQQMHLDVVVDDLDAGGGGRARARRDQARAPARHDVPGLPRPGRPSVLPVRRTDETYPAVMTVTDYLGAHGPRTDAGHVGRVRRSRRAPQRCLRRVLVHLFPDDARREDVRPGSNRELKERLVRRAGRTPPWSSTVTSRSRGRSSAAARSCRTSTTASSTTRRPSSTPTTGSPASSSTSATADGASPPLALHGAVELIAAGRRRRRRGIPARPRGTRVAVLYNGTRSLFEREGFELVRQKGQRNTVMRRTVAPSSPRVGRTFGPTPTRTPTGQRRGSAAAPRRRPPAARCAPSGRRP